jgi:prepilin-type N-terminal cleavage/methylation domain-containing protein
MNLSSSRRRSGLTLVEMIVSTAVFSVAMAAMLTASVALQTSYVATDDYFVGEGDQLRVMDYFNTDLRRALAVGLNADSVTYNGATYSNSVPAGATKYLTVVIPNYKNDSTSPATTNFPTVTSDKVSYGATPVKVSYYLLGNSLFRQEVDPDLGPTDKRNLPRSIADNVSDFNITNSFVTNPLTTETFVSISATFAPKYSRRGWTAALTLNTASRTGTTMGNKIQLRNLSP